QMDSQEFGETIAGLSLIPKRVALMERCRASSQEKLRKMLAEVHASRKTIDTLPRLVMILRIVALDTRIENARLNGADNDFSSVEEQVAALAADIEQHSADIISAAAEVEELVRRTSNQLDELGARQQSEIASLTTYTASGLESFRENHARSASAVQ